MNIYKWWASTKGLRNNHAVKYGIPFLVLALGGSFYLEQFSKLKFKYGLQASLVDRAELQRQGLELRDKKELTLEAQYEKMKELDIDNWEQIRGPRPWEEPTQQQ